MTNTNDDIIQEAFLELDRVEARCKEKDANNTKAKGIAMLDVYEAFNNAELMTKAYGIAKQYFDIGFQDMERYRRKLQVMEILGRYPKNPDDYVELYAEYKKVQVTPSIIKDKLTLSGETCYSDHYDNLYAFLMDYDIPYKKDRLDIAGRQWHEMQIAKFNFHVFDKLKQLRGSGQELKDNQEIAEAHWEVLVSIIEKNEARRQHTKVILQHFIWQTKRMMNPFENHKLADPILPVLVGKTGNGKSTAVEWLLSPLGVEGECWIKSQFSHLLDPNYYQQAATIPVAFMDEMSFLQKADRSALKAFLTSENVQARKMYSQNIIFKKRIIQPIGTSNESLSVILTDTTSSRRLYEIETPDDMASQYPDWFKDIDWVLLWQSVNIWHKSPYHTSGLKNEIFKIQHNEQRATTSIEDWMNDQKINGTFKATPLYDLYKAWAQTYDERQAHISLTKFGKEIRQITDVVVTSDRSGTNYIINKKYGE